MSSNVTIAVDLAKNVFQLAVSNPAGRITEHRRFSRPQFERFWHDRLPCRVVMEACASAHFWARHLSGLGFEVVLLPPHYVRPYVRRNKTDRTDCEALLEALRCSGIHPVSIKSEDQQAVAALHRVRSQWMATRTARINTMRALLREFGITCPAGARRFLDDLTALVEAKQSLLPPRLRATLLELWQEVRDLEARIDTVEAELAGVARQIPVLKTLLEIPGVGVLTATALWAAIGSVHTFQSGRHLASWLGLTPRESSSGSRRRLGGISKQGDPYLRMLLIHGARSALRAAQQRHRAGKPLTRLQEWAVTKAQAQHYNSAAVALANKTARVIWAVWHYERSFDGNHLPQAA
jgi:transposase